MRVDVVWHWLCDLKALPEKFQGEGPFDVTLEDIEALAENFDVMLHNAQGKQPTKKERGRGVKPEPDKLYLYCDQKYKRFTQR